MECLRALFGTLETALLIFSPVYLAFYSNPNIPFDLKAIFFGWQLELGVLLWILAPLSFRLLRFSCRCFVDKYLVILDG